MAANSHVNFLPEDYLERRRQQRTNVVCLSLFGVVMIGLIGAFMLDEKRQAKAASKRDTVSQQMQAAGRQILQFEDGQARKEKMMRKAEVTASLLERRPRDFLLAFITNGLPKGSSLLSIELSTREPRGIKSTTPAEAAKAARASRAARPGAAAGKPAADPKAEAPKPVEIIKVTGLAPDDKVVSKYIAALDSCPLFKEVELVFSEEHSYQEHAVRRFMLQMELNDQAAVTEEMVAAQRARPDAFTQ